MTRTEQVSIGAIAAAPLAFAIDYTRRPKAYIAWASRWLHVHAPHVLPSVVFVDFSAVLALLGIALVVFWHFRASVAIAEAREIVEHLGAFTRTAASLFVAHQRQDLALRGRAIPPSLPIGGPSMSVSTSLTPSPLVPVAGFVETLLQVAEANIPKLKAYLDAKNVVIADVIVAEAKAKSPFLGMIAEALHEEFISQLGNEEQALISALEFLAQKEIAKI